MPAGVIDGKALAERIRGEIAQEVRELGEIGLATVLVGDDPASDIYIRLKHKAAAEVGINARDIRLASQTTEAELLEQVARLNADESIDGLLVQLPLPDHIDEARVIRALDPVKDVDGLHPLNFGQLVLGRPTHVGATPVGVMRLLEENGVELEGARAVVVGRSDIVGKPAALLLLHANATVTVCHSRTRDLGAVTREADVLVVAVGRTAVIGPDDVREGATVIDVGMNRGDEGVVGDVDPGAAERAGLITPVPGGVGPMTIAMLLASAVKAAKYRRGILAFPGG
ncbi:MAG: bifunctional 5,10-methylenetetrahydrofolate dehydrogenase/5,10-methenyltetrahydrofolate cyclohydrolase [Actinobacteria bacterium]|nr:MAG: bifunctional 5,10-methylenetetrahydrofolate dehydrogenase/5,10-methenyltetrahydrofolate cyclohydrolase [Actinomycetota bacterium]